MKLKILLFGILAYIAGKSGIEIEIEIDKTADTDSLQKKVNETYPDFIKTNYALSLNKKIVNSNQQININDEIALLPPFAGG